MFCPSQRFFHSTFCPSQRFLHSMFFLVNVSQSILFPFTFCPSRHYFQSTFCPIRRFFFRRFVLQGFYRRRFLLRHSVSEPSVTRNQDTPYVPDVILNVLYQGCTISVQLCYKIYVPYMIRSVSNHAVHYRYGDSCILFWVYTSIILNIFTLACTKK
jgi:hypothetical protein